VSYYLGIFGGVGTNPSAALLYKKKIIAFAEEERFTRIKTLHLHYL
jgi:predicted NodU family carbamoyl transferase